MTKGNSAKARRQPSVLIIGAGMTGICLAIKLREAGISDLLMIEKGSSVGGTWRENTYPGVACDIPSHAYTYSFAQNPDWSSLLAGGAEIHAYFKSVFEQYQLDNCTRLNEKVLSSVYQEGRWHVQTDQGNHHTVDLLFAASGMLHQPVTPELPGRAEFSGAQFHSAQWNHEVELEGKRIAVVGTGSSATQLIPKLINTPGTRVTVFQRTPQWVVKVENEAYSAEEQQQFRNQPDKARKLARQILWVYDKTTTALTGQRLWHRLMRLSMAWNARRYLNQAVKNPELKRKLTPDYAIGCKRVVLASGFYEALQQDNAELITDSISAIEDNGIRTSTGEFHEIDVIVYATGFNPVAYMRPMKFLGQDGLDIESVWKDKVQAYRSVLLPGFPNFFLMIGPNSPIGNYSIISIAEAQTAYAMQLVEAWRDGRLDKIDVSAAATQEWNQKLRAKLKDTVWATGGCNSWYLDADGDPLSWPDSWQNFLRSIESPKWDDFVGANAGSAESSANA